MNVSIYIEEEQLDLFKDETIEITSSIQDVNDITKNTLDYSKNFTVPASNNNNKILKHWYNSDIDNGFDARVKIDGRIEINGVVFKYGKFSLTGAKIKQGKASSYSLVFYGNAISLVDLLGNDELSDLDLSAYDHQYNDTNVLNYFLLNNGDLIYPLIAKKRYYYNSSTINDGGESTLNHSNIANVSWSDGIYWEDLRASLRLIRIIEAIETKYGFTFSKEFFNRVEFYNLYLWLDNEKQKEINNQIEVDYTSIGQIQDLIDDGIVEFNLSQNWFKFLINPSNIYGYQYAINITPSAGYETVPYTVINKVGVNGDEDYYEINKTGYSSIVTDSRGQINQKNKYFIKSNSEFKFKAEINIYNLVRPSPKVSYYVFYYSGQFNEQTLIVNYEIAKQIPKIKTIDFLKGLFQMFKLVLVQDKSTEPIYVNTLKDYYSTALLYDITEYVNTNSYDIERGKLLNEIVYKYEDPQTILNKKFKENTGLGYGDNGLVLLEDINDPNSKKLDGEKEEIKLPFEQVVYERLIDLNTETDTSNMCGQIIDDKYEAVNIKPHIHYVVNTVPNTIKFLKNDNTFVSISAGCNMPSHTIDYSTNPSYSLVFDREFSNYTRIAIDNTLYMNYHNDYISSIFNVKRRNLKVEAKLPLRIILNLKLKDVLKIKDKYYRINEWTYNLLTGLCKFDLINSFDNTIAGFNANVSVLNFTGAGGIQSIYVTNFNNLTFDFDATWINSLTYLDNNVYFGVDANDTGLIRTATVTLINSDTLAEIIITINQTYNTITFGNEIITWGQTDITFES